MSTYFYEEMHAHLIFMITSERLSQLNFKIHKVNHKE
jgi:hypothetical protein